MQKKPGLNRAFQEHIVNTLCAPQTTIKPEPEL